MDLSDPNLDLGKLAYAQPPIVPTGDARILVAVSILFAVLGFIVVVARVIFRWWLRASRTERTAWGWDDVLAAIALVPFEIQCVWSCLGAYYGLGMRDDDLGGNKLVMMRAAEYIAYFQICHALCVPFIKASIAVALMRITDARKYRYPLYFVILASTVLCLAGWISLVSLCKPTAALWNPTLGKCGNYDPIVKISYVVSIVTIITDWTCAIIPFFVLRKLQVSMRTKFLLLGVLGMGIFASVAAIVRYPWLKYYSAPKDQLWYTSHIILWCIVESGLGLLAGSLPPLHKLRTVLARRRATRTAQSGNISNSLEGSQNGAVVMDRISKGTKHNRHGTKTGHSTFVAGGEWDRLSDDAASGKHIIHSRSVQVHVDTDSMESSRENKSVSMV